MKAPTLRVPLLLWAVVLSACSKPNRQGSLVESSTPVPSAPTVASAPVRSTAPGLLSCGGVEGCRTQCESCAKDCPLPVTAACLALGNYHLRDDTGQFDTTRAGSFFDRGCRGGDPIACSAHALLLQDGRGVPQDRERAMALYARACAEGAGVGCYNLAQVYKHGVGVDIDEAKAEGLFAKARVAYERQCGQRDLQWCMNLGVLYELGQGVPRDLTRALGLYRDACDGGHDESCVNLALLQMDEAKGQDDRDHAISTLRGTCERGTALGCGALGQVYWKGESGAERDLERALPLLDGACRGGNPQACATLGAVLALAGPGIPGALERAHQVERRACELGVSSACLLLGQEMLDARQPVVAAEWFERGCQIGDGESCGMWAGLLEVGMDVPKDPAKAIALHREACRMGFPGSCVVLLRRKLPLPLPPRLKDAFLRAACENRVPEACLSGAVK